MKTTPPANVPAAEPLLAPQRQPWLRRRGGDLLAILFLAAFTLLVFWKGLADPPGMIGGDAAYLYQDYYTLAAREVQAGRVPLWNPYILMGVPFHASLQPALFYPLRWQMFYMDYVPGYVLTVMLHYFLGAVSAYLFMRAAVGVRALPALIGALSIAFGGLAMGHASHPNYFLAYPWFFGVLTCLFLAVKRRQWRWAAPAGGCVGLMLLIGAVHLLLVLNVLVWAYAGYQAVFGLVDFVRDRAKGWGAIVRPIGVAGAAMVLGVLIGAIQFLPAQALSGRSVRKEASWGFVNMAVASPGPNTLQMIAPYYYGNMRLGYWNEFSFDEMAHYTGIAVLLLAVAGIATTRRERHSWALIMLAIVGFLLGAGDSLPVYRVFYELLPPFRQLRNPTRIFWLTDIALAALAALGAQRILYGRPSDGASAANPKADAKPADKADRKGDRHRSLDGANGASPLSASPLSATLSEKEAARARTALLVAAAIVVLVVIGALVSLHSYAQDPRGAASAVDENKKIGKDMWYPVRIEDARRAPKAIFSGDGPTWGSVAAAIASAALFGALALRLRKGAVPRWAGPAVVAVLTADLFAGSFGMVMYNKQFSLLREEAGWMTYVREHAGLNRCDRVVVGTESSRQMSDVNRGMMLDFRQVHGLGGGIVDSPERSQFTYACGPVQVGDREFALLPGPRAVAGVRYYVTNEPRALASLSQDLRPVWSSEGWSVLENANALPMVWFVDRVAAPRGLAINVLAGDHSFDPAKTALVATPPAQTSAAGPAKREANVVEAVPGLWRIAADAGKPGQLVVSEGFDPGWRAEIDGQPAPVYQTDDQVMSVAVPAGRHEVMLKYDPPEFRRGVWVTVGGLTALVLLLAAGFLVAPRWKKSEDNADALRAAQAGDVAQTPRKSNRSAGKTG